MIDFAQTEHTIKQIAGIFLDSDCKVLGHDGCPVEGLEITVRQKHSMLKRIYSSKEIPLELKLQAMAKLEGFDKSDLLGRTKKYCEAALPTADNKKAVWQLLFDGKEEMSMKEVWELCAGFKQLAHRDLIQEFDTVFFERIEQVVQSKQSSISEAYYFYLQPNLMANDEEIGRFSLFLEKLESVDKASRKEGADRLINWVKDSIQDLREKQAARELSRQWMTAK